MIFSHLLKHSPPHHNRSLLEEPPIPDFLLCTPVNEAGGGGWSLDLSPETTIVELALLFHAIGGDITADVLPDGTVRITPRDRSRPPTAVELAEILSQNTLPLPLNGVLAWERD